MLKQKTLENTLLDMFNTTLPNAFEMAMLESYPVNSEIGKKKAKQFGETICKYLAEHWARDISKAIDAYIKNIELHGTVITVGSPTTQTAIINCTPTPTINGSIPNTLKIT